MLPNPYFSPPTAQNADASKFGHRCEPLRTVASWIRAVVHIKRQIRRVNPAAEQHPAVGLRIGTPVVLGEQDGEEWGERVEPARRVKPPRRAHNAGWVSHAPRRHFAYHVAAYPVACFALEWSEVCAA